MPTRQELLNAAREADKAGDESAARRLVAMAEAQGKTKQETPDSGGPSGFMPFLNKGISDIAGAPVDVVNWGLGKVGLGSDRPFGGSESIRGGMENLGAPTPNRPPASVLEYMGQTVGETAAASVPMLKGAQMLAKGSGVASKVAAPIVQAAVERPIATAAAEMIAASGAGVGRQFGEEHNLGAGGKLTSEFVGGAVPAVLTSLSPLSLLTRTGKKIGGWAVAPFTEKGAFLRASRRMQEVAEDPIKAALNIEDLKGANLSVSAASQDPGLMAIENTVLKDNPAMATHASRSTSEATDALVKSVRRSGDINNTRAFVKAKLDRLDKAIELRVEQAGDEASAALAKIGGDEASASIAVQDSLKGALADAKVQEHLLWQTIPFDTRASTKPLMDVFNGWKNKLSAAQLPDMPPTATRILGRAKNVTKTTMRELDGLYKKLGEEATAARASSNFTQARIAEDLRDGILKSMDTAEGGKAVSEAVGAARAYSRSMNERFRRGAVGRILGYGSAGGPRIAPELSLQATVASPGVKSRVAMDEISSAAQFGGRDDSTVLEGVQSFLKDRFLKAALDSEGKVVPSKADSFLLRNRELLDSFPHLREQLSAARNTEDTMRRVVSKFDGFRRANQKKGVSATARLLGAPVDKEIATLMNSTDPVGMMSRLIKMVAKDGTGEALDGLKAGFSEWLINRSTSGGVRDIAGRPVFHGMQLKTAMENKHTAAVMQQLYGKSELRNIQKAADTLSRIDRRAGVNASSPIINDTPAWWLSILGRVAGAKAGASMSGTTGGSIQAASIGSSAVNKFLKGLTADKAQQMIVDAFQNPELMNTLLTYKPALPAAVKARHERAIRAWMVASGSRLLEPDLYEEAKEEQKTQKPQGLIRIR